MILSEQQVLELRIELEELITEREGMMTLNSSRINQGWSIAYDDVSFNDVKERMRAIRGKLINLSEKRNVT